MFPDQTHDWKQKDKSGGRYRLSFHSRCSFHNSSARQLRTLTFQFKLYSSCLPRTFEMNFYSQTGRVGDVKLFLDTLVFLFVRTAQVVRKASSWQSATRRERWRHDCAPPLFHSPTCRLSVCFTIFYPAVQRSPATKGAIVSQSGRDWWLNSCRFLTQVWCWPVWFRQIYHLTRVRDIASHASHRQASVPLCRPRDTACIGRRGPYMLQYYPILPLVYCKYQYGISWAWNQKQALAAVPPVFQQRPRLSQRLAKV